MKTKQNGSSLHLATSCGSLSLVLQCVSIRSWLTTLSILSKCSHLQHGATMCNVRVKSCFVFWKLVWMWTPKRREAGSFLGCTEDIATSWCPGPEVWPTNQISEQNRFDSYQSKNSKLYEWDSVCLHGLWPTSLSSVLVHLIAECTSSCVLWINTTNKHKELCNFKKWINQQ